MVPPQPAARPANTANTNIHGSRSSAGRNGSRNIAPKAMPVASIDSIHNRTLPNRRDNGIHSGTDKADGTM